MFFSFFSFFLKVQNSRGFEFWAFQGVVKTLIKFQGVEEKILENSRELWKFCWNYKGRKEKTMENSRGYSFRKWISSTWRGYFFGKSQLSLKWSWSYSGVGNINYDICLENKCSYFYNIKVLEVYKSYFIRPFYAYN